MPVIVTFVPPATGPSVAEIFVTVGGTLYVNLTVSVETTPDASLTTTSSSPAAVAAVFAVISVAETTTTEVAALPILTVAPFRKPVPLILTAVPPAVEPNDGSIAVTVGGVTYVYIGPAEEIPFESLTTTSSLPIPSPVFAVISVAETTLTSVALLPIVTVAPSAKPVPLILTAVLPSEVPSAGVIEVTVGGVSVRGTMPSSVAADYARLSVSGCAAVWASADAEKLNRSAIETDSADAAASTAEQIRGAAVRGRPCGSVGTSMRLDTAKPPGSIDDVPFAGPLSAAEPRTLQRGGGVRMNGHSSCKRPRGRRGGV
jgi:hypothetical protein